MNFSFDEIVEAERNGRVRIGVDRAFARKLYTEVPIAVIKEKTGDTPYAKKFIVSGALFLSPIVFLASAVLAVFMVRWWAILLIPTGFIIWFGLLSASFPRISSLSLILGGSLCMLAISKPSARLYWTGGVAFAASLWLNKLVYFAATHFFHNFVKRNRNAFEWLGDSLRIREVE